MYWERFTIRGKHEVTAIVGFTVPRVPQERNPHRVLECLGIADEARAEVRFYELLGRAAVVISDEGSLLAHARDNVRSASRESGWDVDVFSTAEFDQLKQKSLDDFASIAELAAPLREWLVNHGCFTFDELSVVDPEVLMKAGAMEMEDALHIIEQAERRAGY